MCIARRQRSTDKVQNPASPTKNLLQTLVLGSLPCNEARAQLRQWLCLVRKQRAAHGGSETQQTL